MMNIKKTIAIISSFFVCLLSMGQDSLRSVMLEEVKVVSSSLEDKNRQASTIVLSGSQIEKTSFQSVGEAVKFLSGVNVKDYGGTGGLKTVSVRGLGAMHTNVTYDGVSITNAQNGQTDLSKFRTDNIDNLSLSNGNPVLRLQTAKSLASANTISMESRKPHFAADENTNGYINTLFGSFNLGSLVGSLNHRFSKRTSVGIYADVVSSKGDFPYTLHYGNLTKDSTSEEIRKNNDFFSAHAEADLFFESDESSMFKAKAYFYHSERALAGPTTLYWQNSKQRLWDKDAFVQSSYKRELNQYTTYKNHLKLSYAHTRYYDPSYNNAQGFQDDRYTQKEAYLNNILSLHKQDKMSLSLTNDLIATKLDAQNNYILDPLRLSSLTAVVAAYRLGIFTIDANLLHTYTTDKAHSHTAYPSQNHFSPFVSIGMKTDNFEMSIFYKDIFRLPTFNDLYYNSVGETDLRPEKTKQYSLHTAYRHSREDINRHLFIISADLFHNSVSDKIVATPRNNLFVWSMVNYGKVQIDGVEIVVQWQQERIIKSHNLRTSANLTYNYTHAFDNSPESLSYRKQIIYSPLHSGNAMISIDLDKTTLCYTATCVGKRYTDNQNNERSSLQPYGIHSLSLSHSFGKTTIKLSCDNLTDTRYEVIKAYPMPGRQWIINLKYKF